MVHLSKTKIHMVEFTFRQVDFKFCLTQKVKSTFKVKNAQNDVFIKFFEQYTTKNVENTVQFNSNISSGCIANRRQDILSKNKIHSPWLKRYAILRILSVFFQNVYVVNKEVLALGLLRLGRLFAILRGATLFYL